MGITASDPVSGLDAMRFYHDTAEIRNGADTREVDVSFQSPIICGKFVDDERPTFNDLMDEHYGKLLGDRYVPTPPEGGMLHER